jgi:hypothetical protein
MALFPFFDPLTAHAVAGVRTARIKLLVLMVLRDYRMTK